MLPRSLLFRSLRRSAPSASKRALQTLANHSSQKSAQPNTTTRSTTLSQQPVSKTFFRSASHTPTSTFPNAKTPSDEKIEEITELYATAQDEFEIAMEETEKMTVYAEEDRKAAREELEKVLEAFKQVIEGEDQVMAEEVKRRIGQRIRELEHGVKAMEELAQNQD